MNARPGEQPWAFIPAVDHPERNRYGMAVETVPPGDPLRGQSLRINGGDGVGDNPHRYKQHGFYFTADRCIACHACEAACAEKNNTPSHLAFRSVGYLEGGSWPAYQRLNISMACNHCDNPVCLKGCPTRAYTKFAEYGAVLQDPDICFGCGYCTWVCPYNAPQLDPLAGHVSKCNMCVDRLEAGLKPACAAACLAGALDFGIIETRPTGRERLETTIPGFPDPSITHPNIRFQQVRSLPRELSRPDGLPVRYVRDTPGDEGQHRSVAGDASLPSVSEWAKLSTRENPLVLFTLATQCVVGAFLFWFLAGVAHGEAFGGPGSLANRFFLATLVLVEAGALVVSTLHLGRPHRFYRAFNNLKWSPVSREVAGVAVFFSLLGLQALWLWLPVFGMSVTEGWPADVLVAAGWGAVVAGPMAIWFMHRIYRIPARPWWNHWQVLTSFFGNVVTLGALAVLVLRAVLAILPEGGLAADALLVPPLMGYAVACGLVAEGIGLWFHARDARNGAGEAAASHLLLTTQFSTVGRLRNLLLGAAALAALALTWGDIRGVAALMGWGAVGAMVFAQAVLGRLLFYAAVIPMTMPGAFFWRNRAFEAHARKTGLADMPQTGVAVIGH